ncbi:MAG TPA: alpha/beta hydrolase [Thermoplasmata archaeon]|nr:alpha/beta hydrolase [Thermoplasmata archaeon]
MAPLPPGVYERFLEAGGIRFRSLSNTSPGSAAGLDRSILLLHGYPMWAEVWLPLVARLRTTRAWFAPDLPCHNRSGSLAKADRSVTGYRKAIQSLFDALGLTRATVVGSSLGGTLAIMLALDRAKDVERLIVLDAAGLVPTLPKKTVRLYLPFVLPSYLRAPGPKAVRKLLERAVFHDPRRIEVSWIESIADQWRPRSQRSAFIATGNALRRPDASVSTELERILVPTLLIWGRQDPQFDWRIGEAASRRIPNARFIPIEECGHFPMVEKPEETAAAVSAFLTD